MGALMKPQPQHEPDFEVRVPAVVEKAAAIEVRDQETYTLAGEQILAATAMQNEIKAYHAPLKDAAHRAHKAICDAEKRLLDPLVRVVQALRPKVVRWEQEQERLRREEQVRLESEVKHQQEDDLLALAERAQAEGADPAEVDHIISQPLPPARVVVPPTFERVSGLSMRENWRAEVRDLKTLARAVADGKASEDFLLGLARSDDGSITSPTLNTLARAIKTGLSVPGVVAVKDVGTVARVR